MHPDTQRELFTQAVELLGGQQKAAAALGMSDRSLRYLLDGTRRLHDGILADICNALIAHAATCRAIESKLNPAFTANRTELQDVPLHADPKRWQGGKANG